LFVLANLLAVAGLADGRRLLPGMLAAGAIVQTVLLVLVASRGVTWVVYGQLFVMAILVAVLAVTTLTRYRRQRIALDPA
jgi:uncharacterized membrane protein